jgi:hypothetical protein
VCWCKWCKFRASKDAKALVTFDVVRCANVRFRTTFHVWTTLSEHYGVQGVAGSNPAVPIAIQRVTNVVANRGPFRGPFLANSPR